MLFRHARHVVLQRRHFFAALGRVVAQEFGQLGAVGGVFVDTQLQVLAKRLVELFKAFRVLGNLGEHLQDLLDQVLANNLQNLVLLQDFTRNVERQVLRRCE